MHDSPAFTYLILRRRPSLFPTCSLRLPPRLNPRQRSHTCCRLVVLRGFLLSSHNVLAFPDSYLFEWYRFTSQSILYIHNLICPYICNITNRSHALTSHQILCVALRFFANGSFLYNVGDAEHLSKATVCRAVRKVCLALKRLLHIFVVFPGHKPVRAIKEEFHRTAGESDGLLLGDRGYPCQPRLMTPYPDPEPGPQQNFNRAHCRTRARVEMTIGLLKAHFQCLRHLRVTPERACDIIVACVVLHNIATIRGEQHPALQFEDPDDDPIHLPAIQDGGAVRDTICHNHFRV
ncbi:uncharacterized protein LOC121942291 [Plectropomus leopardus]|uniref:uncharacterized protein LOC121942291 n=1 Tax=Plectropomus leopardus TaxID=160734 RepID=UPI001C4BF54D|nr:uncharacterized protein LOC121942291 [Plectropomus leopardus]